MFGRRRFLKLIVGLGTAGAGVGWLRQEAGAALPVTLGQASFESVASSSTVPPPVPTTAPDSLAPLELVIISKEGWGASPVVGTFVEHEITRITIHHTASLLEDNSDAPGRMREHQAYHQQDLGWPDLAYHYIVDRNGHIYEGRPVWAVGDTSTNYDPTGHLLICCEGEFNSQLPSEPQLASTVGLIAWGSSKFGVGLDTVFGHRDVASTSCPGDAVYTQLGSLVARSDRLLGDSIVTLTTLDDRSGLVLVADVEAGRV